MQAATARARRPGRRRRAPHEVFSGRNELRALVGTIGAKLVAEFLGVSRQQPSAWAAGEGISAENRRKISDLYHVVDRVSQVVAPSRLVHWLSSPNVVFNGGRPQDVFRLRGAAPIIDVIDRVEEGGYA
jgi:hypothetical protein